MSSRDDILATLRAARDASQSTAPVDEVPREYRLEGEEAPGSAPVIAEFTEKLVDYHVEVHEVDADEVPAAISQILKEHSIGSIVVPDGLDGAWKDAAGSDGRTVLTDSPESPQSKETLNEVGAVLTASRVAISLSGTIILDGQPDQGRRIITLLPDLHVCVVRAENVQPTVPQAVAIIGEHPQRPITWIAGGSATSDIELVRVDGVHGPRTLTVIIAH